MKTINFIKMQGAGNDFIVIDAPKSKLDLRKFTAKICDRHMGVGADGVLILDKSKTDDYRMRIINADGSEAEMCGNGARCMAAYIAKTRKPNKKIFTMETLAGSILAEAKGEMARVRLSAPKDYQEDVSIEVNEREMTVSYIDTGVPHTIVFVDGLPNMDVQTIGKAIRFNPQFAPRGTNVNFVEQIAPDCVALRTYERGVEGETLACGTGSVAAALVGFLQTHPNIRRKKKAMMKVRTASGEVLEVTFNLDENKISEVWLKGSAKFIAEGTYYLQRGKK